MRKHSAATKRRLVLALKARWKDPEKRAILMAARKAQVLKPEEIERRRRKTKAAWKRKDYRDKQTKTRATSYAYNVTRRKSLSIAITGGHSWNAGHSKETHPTLARFSKRLIGTIPRWSYYTAWYRSGKKSIRMRSSWEVKFAKWCDAKNIKWQYEPRWFNIGKGSWRGVSYTPDFYLPETKQWVEIKGYLTKANKRKLEAFKQQHPKLNWVMYQSKELKAMRVI